ncbi:MAG: hypothetical protein JSU96_02900, partial [Acidobacteriota bacterium]
MKREPIGDILVGSRKGERQSTDAERKGANSDKPSASLYDDTLSGKRTKRRWVPIVWAFLGLIVVGGMVVFVTRSSGEKVAELENFEPKELDRSSPLAQVVDDVRRRPEEGTTDEGTEPQPAQGGDESVAKEVEPPPAPVPATPASPPRE